MEIERRIVEGPVEVRAGADGEMVIAGYAALYNVWSVDLGGFREQILPGAFAERLSDDVRALWQHDPLHVFGRTASGTLTLSEDAVGLRFEVTPPDAQWARDALASIRRGDVSQCSFAFALLEDGQRWDVNDVGEVSRTITRFARLYDVSPVTYAAYPDTSVSVQQRAEALRARGGDAVSMVAEEMARVREALRLRADVRARRGSVRRPATG